MNKERTIDAIIKWIERRIFHANGYRPPTKDDLHVWLKHAKKFKREQDNLKSALKDAEGFIDLFDLEDLEGDFNHGLNMQRKAHDGNRDDITRNFWLDHTRHKMKIIESFKALKGIR